MSMVTAPTRADGDAGHPDAFIGTWIQLVAVVVAVVAGIAALAGRNQRLARA